MKFFASLIGLLLAATVNTAAARQPVPIVNHENVAITSATGKTLDNAKIQQAITRAATQNQWTVVPAGDNKLVATLLVRRHTVVTDISWTPEAYNIRYKSSIDMDYYPHAPGTAVNTSPVIHPFYNKWVAKLRDSISRELAQQP